MSMAKNKFYMSAAWLTRKYNHERLSEKEIAELCGVSQVTINRYLHQFGLKRER